MRRTLSICLLAVVALSSRPLAAPENTRAASGPVTVKLARLVIDGTSTMHAYRLSTGTLVVNSLVADTASLLQPAALKEFELEIPVNGFVSEKDGLIKKFLETMKAGKHPTIVFRLADYSVDGSVVRAKGTLTVAGMARDIDLEINATEMQDGIQLRGSRKLSMTEFGIKPPTMFMGMLKTDDTVTVTFELQLALAAKASN